MNTLGRSCLLVNICKNFVEYIPRNSEGVSICSTLEYTATTAHGTFSRIDDITNLNKFKHHVGLGCNVCVCTYMKIKKCLLNKLY